MKISAVKRLFVGSPLATAQARHERLSKTSALAVFSSDALSSVAYATEEILLVLVIAGTATMNLRGLRESSNLFAVPTYLFVVSFAGMLAYGFVRWAAGWETPPPPAADFAVTEDLTLFLVLRAFSSGCAALTGVEAEHEEERQ